MSASNPLIRLSKSSIGQEEKKHIVKVLDKEFLGMGQEVQEFELALQTYLGTSKEVICVNTGTAALHLSILCLGIGPGDEVLVPSLTYVASFQAISATGATPIPCDCLENTLFIDPKDAKNRITPNTKAIMPVHYASDSQYMDQIYTLAKEHRLRIIEDAAHAFGCTRNGKKIGVEGDIICFSFDGIKNITSGEGGAIVTNDEDVIQRVKNSRLLGVEKDSEKRYKNQRSWSFDVTEQGFRYHMSNIMAAIGQEQLIKIESITKKRQSIAKKYISAFKNNPHIQLLSLDYQNIVPHIFVIRINSDKRDSLKQFLEENKIESGIHYPPNHQLTKFKSSITLPTTEKVFPEIISIPCHTDLSTTDQNRVIDKINIFFEQ